MTSPEREAAVQRLAAALMNAYNETVGGKLDEYPDGVHFLRCARIAAEEIDAALGKQRELLEGWIACQSVAMDSARLAMGSAVHWAQVCPEEKP